MTNWNSISPNYLAYQFLPMQPQEIDELPYPFNAMVWSTIVEVRKQAYEYGCVDGYRDAQDDYDLREECE